MGFEVKGDDMNTQTSPPAVTPAMIQRISNAFDLLGRYSAMDYEKATPLIAVRSLCLRVGLGRVLQHLEKIGPDALTGHAMIELTNIADLLDHMMRVQPPSAELKDGVLDGVNILRKAAADEAVKTKVHAFLSRVALREAWMKERKASGDKPTH